MVLGSQAVCFALIRKVLVSIFVARNWLAVLKGEALHLVERARTITERRCIPAVGERVVRAVKARAC